MECPNCHNTNKDGRKYCKNCGRQLVFFCVRCGFANDMDDSFCGGCGINLEDMVTFNLNDMVDLNKGFDPEAFPTIAEGEEPKKERGSSEKSVKEILDVTSISEDTKSKKADHEDEEAIEQEDVEKLF